MQKQNFPRADALARQAFPGLSRSQVEEAFELGWVVGPQGQRLSKGDKIPSVSAPLLEEHLLRVQKGNPKLQVAIVLETPDFWIVDKPAGMPGHPVHLKDDATLTHWALAQRPELSREFPEPQPTLTPHRLDTGTSGLQVVAKTRAAYETWRELFAGKEVEKTYEAWCWGEPEENSWIVDEPIGKAKTDKTRWRVGGIEPRPAYSEVDVAERGGGKFLARVHCHTGVTHQVRIHLAHSGFPLLGDALYDPHYATRSEKPEWHQLRAVGLRWPGGGVSL